MRKKLGFMGTNTKYCHMIRDANKLTRVLFCEDMLANGTTFTDCVFTDKCTIQADCSTRKRFVLKNDFYSRLRTRAKHPAKVHIWAGISMRRPTNIVIISGSTRIDSELYCKFIERAYLSFVENTNNGRKER
ncbi:hypothetical protein OESDEN_06960 [Oesophagostomum dentatum]|uniref:Uncharacterized protein n=1 Tax=Oesophagostomum dentatum TaxID=61180 RepID=A0A0B1T7F4_OESDE|nr:hypothetical protein OESDEN_06960 [Oesophagostomum dentatum]